MRGIIDSEINTGEKLKNYREAKELKRDEIGVIFLSDGCGYINLRDRRGDKRLWLPWVKGDGEEEEKRVKLLTELGYDVTKIKHFGLNEKDEKYHQKAIALMPAVLAGTATFNMESRPNLDIYEPNRLRKKKVIGVTGKTHTGKTAALMLTKIANGDKVRIWDWDPFSKQSFDVCLGKVKGIMEDRGIGFENLGGTMNIVKEVYDDIIKQDRSEYRLENDLEAGVLDYLVNVLGHDVTDVLIDLSGEDMSKGKRERDVFDYLKMAVPTMELSRYEREEDYRPLFDEKAPDAAAGWTLGLYSIVATALGREFRPMPPGAKPGWAVDKAGEFEKVFERAG